jgi:SAM-dependent methyltransferase
MKDKSKNKKKKKAVTKLEARVKALEDVLVELGDSLQRDNEAPSPQMRPLAGLLSQNHKRRYFAKVWDVLATPDFDYFLFESMFRGEPEDIRERQSLYLPYFIGKENVLDIGCGRGEFLELLNESFIPAYGIDLNRDNILYCEERDLKVLHVDAFEHLQQVPEASLGGIYLGQVIEHMEPQQLLKLASLCLQALRPDGVLIADTLNPDCLVAQKWFWLDPTHVKLIPKELAIFVFDQAGFFDCEAINLSPVPDSERLEEILSDPEDSPEIRRLKEILSRNLQKLNKTLYGYQEYALIAHAQAQLQDW